MKEPNDNTPRVAATFWIYKIETSGPGSVIASGRCYTALCINARFQQIHDAIDEIDLIVARILFYGRSVEKLDPGCSAQVTLKGTGGHLVKAGHIIEGVNPAG